MTDSLALDCLAGLLPIPMRDRMAEIITADDAATLAHLAEKGLGPNSLRALASDLAYLEGWAQAATGAPLPWPAPEALILKFVAHHLFDPAEKRINPDHGLPDAVLAALTALGLRKGGGPHAVATVRRRLTHWARFHRWRGHADPITLAIREAVRLSARASTRPKTRKSARAITRDVLDRMLATCRGADLKSLRDRAILLTGFASGGRRRSELSALTAEQVIDEAPIVERRADGELVSRPCLALHLGRTKTESAEEATVYLTGRAAEALRRWMQTAPITRGPLFRAIGRTGLVRPAALTAHAINAIVKSRARLAGYDPLLYSAHGLRSGYLTEAARRNVPILEAMSHSRHKSVQQAASYYNDADRQSGKGARLAE